MWDEAVSHKKFLGGTYLRGKDTIAGRLRWFVEIPCEGSVGCGADLLVGHTK